MPANQTKIEAAATIAAATQDAYSFQAFGKAEWKECAWILLDRGFGHDQVRNLLESKIMRWAADEADEPYRAHARDLERFLDKYRGNRGMEKAISDAANAR